MKPILKIYLLLLLPFFASSQIQEKKADSLKRALRTATADSTRFTIATDLMGVYYESKLNTGLYYAEIALALAEKNNMTMDAAKMLQKKGGYLIRLRKYGAALKSIQSAAKIAEDPTNEKRVFSPKKYPDLRKNRLGTLSTIYIVWANLMGDTTDTIQQMAYYRKAKKIAEEVGDDYFLSIANMNLGTQYLELGKIDSALQLEQIALKLMLKEGGNTKYIGAVYRNIADINILKGDKEKAVENYHKGVLWAVKRNNQTLTARIYNKLATFYLVEKNKDSSLYYAKKQLAVLQLVDSPNLVEVYTTIYKSYELQSNKDSTDVYKNLALLATQKALKEEIKNLGEFQKEAFKEQERLQQLEEEKIESKNKLRNYSLVSVLGLFLIIGFFLYRNNRQKQKANLVLQDQKDKLESSLQELKSTQSQLIQSEKMASLGELTAGIAHEIQNPLNFVNNFSEVSNELIDEIQDERVKNIENRDEELIDEILSDIKQNLEKINHHGKRADAIVKGMLQHSRTSSATKEPTDINKLADEYLRLAYHGLRAKDKSFNATMNTDFDETIGKIEIIPQDIGRVILNLITNAFYAASLPPPDGGGFKDPNYVHHPTVWVSTKKTDNQVLISVRDNGPGIPQNIVDKIFQPFFTTKPTGQGTGLGLSLAYDIVKAHGGELKVTTGENEGTTFTITLHL